MRSQRGYSLANTVIVCYGLHIRTGILVICQFGVEIWPQIIVLIFCNYVPRWHDLVYFGPKINLKTQNITMDSPYARFKYFRKYPFCGLHICPGITVISQFGVEIWPKMSKNHSRYENGTVRSDHNYFGSSRYLLLTMCLKLNLFKSKLLML